MKKIKTLFWTTICKRKLRRVGNGIKINSYCRFTSNTNVGDYCNFNGLKICGKGRVVIGNYFHSGSECMFITENHNYEGEALPYDDTYILKDIIIDDCVWIGSRVLVLGGVHIGEGAIVQAGSVVVDDIPSQAIAGGNPARVFKYRDENHYNRLKENKIFH